MKSKNLGGTSAALLGLCMSAAVAADTGGDLVRAGSMTALADHFGELPAGTLEVLDPAEMQDTQGQLWPLIGAVVTVDLALATFFWGTYVPTVTGTSPTGGLLSSQQY